MNKFNLMQILPTLDSGGVEQGTVDLANYLAKKICKSYTFKWRKDVESFK